jgi:transposase
MPTVNKKSVREELARLESTFKKLNEENKLTPESIDLFNELIEHNSILVADYKEKKKKKTKDNTGKPPKKTEKYETSLTNKGRKGKGKLEKGKRADNTRTIETTTMLTVDTCDQCGTPLTDTPCQCVERRTQIDIIFEKTVHHMDAEIKQCPNCDATV